VNRPAGEREKTTMKRPPDFPMEGLFTVVAHWQVRYQASTTRAMGERISPTGGQGRCFVWAYGSLFEFVLDVLVKHKDGHAEVSFYGSLSLVNLHQKQCRNDKNFMTSSVSSRILPCKRSPYNHFFRMEEGLCLSSP
jgi:hypothetical protein